MTKEFWGKKVGMTQLFVGDKVVPVTAIDVSSWVVTQVKTQERDGYSAIQIGLPRDRYIAQGFAIDWLKKPKKHFAFLKEVQVSDMNDIVVGKSADFYSQLTEADRVDVTGVTKGSGFQGVIRRHDFNGPPGSHGDTMGRAPGGMSFMRSRGRVIKGKKLPGHMGVEKVVMKQLNVVKIERDAHIILVKGSVPGKTGSLVFVRKA